MIPGSQPRRTILKAGLGGFASLSLADVLRLQNQSQASESRTAASERTAVILVWLRGGASHLETFDPKPQATLEFRGPYSPIDTNVPGIQICELLPRLSTIADRYSILRSIAHTGGGHPAGSLQVLAGDPDPQDKLVPVLPDWMSIASYLRSRSNPLFNDMRRCRRSRFSAGIPMFGTSNLGLLRSPTTEKGRYAAPR